MMKTLPSLTALGSLVLTVSLSAQDPSTKAASPFQQVVADYQKSPSDEAVAKVIKLAAAMEQLPPIPEEARRHFVRGGALFKDAKNADDLSQVVDEFKEAVRLAPWWPEARYNYALAQEAAGQYPGAVANLKLYQLFKLPDAEARAAQDKIYALEAKQEKMLKDVGVKEAARRSVQGLAGRWTWHSDKWLANVYFGYQITADGNQIAVTWTEYSGESVANMSGKHSFKGTMNGREINGAYSIDRSMWQGGKVFTYPFRGTISEDGNEIRLRYKTIDITGATGLRPDGWREWDEEAVLKRQ